MSDKCRSQRLKADIRTGIIKIYHAGETHNCLSGVDSIVTISGNGERSGPDVYRYITEEQARYANLFAAAPESSSAERDAVKNGLKDGSLKLAITSVIFVEGIDIPVLNTVINASAGRSSIQTVQRIGRALRKAKGKSGALLIDFYDKTIGSLERQSKARIDIYKSRGWKVIRKKG